MMEADDWLPSWYLTTSIINLIVGRHTQGWMSTDAAFSFYGRIQRTLPMDLAARTLGFMLDCDSQSYAGEISTVGSVPATSTSGHAVAHIIK